MQTSMRFIDAWMFSNNLSEDHAEKAELKKEIENLKARLAALEKKLAELEQELRDSPDA